MARPDAVKGAAANDRRRQAGQVAAYGLVAVLGSTALLSALAIWHLVRRGRMLRAQLGPAPARDSLTSEERTKSPDAEFTDSL